MNNCYKLLSVAIAILLANHTVIAQPLPSIQANGSGGSASATVPISLALNTGNANGVEADWWLVVNGPEGWFHYDLSGQWLPGINFTYQGGLFSFPMLPLLNISGWSPGDYQFYFVVDTKMNGQLDFDSLFYSHTGLTIMADDQCMVDSSQAGGVFSDSDGTAASIDASTRLEKTEAEERGTSLSQADYRRMLGEPILLGGNRHEIAGQFLQDFQDNQWPEAAHYLLRYIQVNGRKGLLFSADGVSGEGMNYHFLALAGLQRLAAGLDGYQDPDNWTPPAGVKKITQPWSHTDIMPATQRWNDMITNTLKLTLPDGTDSGPHDTGLQYQDPADPKATSAWGAGGYHWGYSIEKTALRSYLLPAFGQLGLGDGKLGERDLQVQSLLHFSPKPGINGHAHNDTLMLGLFGRGRNVLSFSGHQNQSHGPENKNMVMVDKTWQNKYVSDIAGRLEIYADFPGVQMARVDASHIMHGGNPNGTGGTMIERYRRTYLQNTIDIEKPYLLDLFEVEGGSAHSYLIRGSVVLEQNYPQSSLNTSSATMPIADSKQADFHTTQMSAYAADQSFWVDITFKDEANLGVRSHFPAQGTAGDLYLNFIKEEWTFTDSVPQYTLHREGTAPLKTTFVAVHEVLDGSGNSFIQSVTQEAIDDEAIAVTVTLTDGRVDTYLVSFAGQKSMSYNGVTANAVLAANASLNGKSDLWMAGGVSVTNGSRSLSMPSAGTTGTLVAVNREVDGAASDSFDTDMSLSAGYELAGQVLLQENFDENRELKFVNSYVIEHVENFCGNTRIHVQTDPGLSVSGTGVEELYYPYRTATSTRLSFLSSATSVPHIAHVSPGKDLSGRIQTQVAHALDSDQNLSLTTLPANATVAYKLNGSNSENLTTAGEISLQDHADVVFGVKNNEGFVEPNEFSERYYKPLPALGGTPGESGLIAKRYTGFTYNFDLEDSDNFYDFARFGEEVVEGLSPTQVPYSKTGSGSGVVVSGYINVPSTGLYRFFTRMDSVVQLKIDDKVLIEEAGMRRVAQWVGEVYLEAGLHKIDVHQYSQVAAYFSVLWEGPDIPYGEIPSHVFFQNK